MTYPSSLEFMRTRFGPNWCVAPRASRKTARYDHVVTPKQYASAHDEWARGHPAWLMAAALPDNDAGRFVRKAVLRALRSE